MRFLLYSTILLAACTDGTDDAQSPNGSADSAVALPDASDSSVQDSSVEDGFVEDSYVEKRCGESAEIYVSLYSAEDIAMLAGCTTLVGRFQEDSVSSLEDFSGLESVRKIEGTLNVFRSPGFRTLRGLENLQTVEGSLFIHLNPNLTSIAALAKLRTVTGNLTVTGNDVLPQSEVDAFGARVVVGGEKTLTKVR